MTDCLDPIALTDEEILRYALDGEPLSDEATYHLKCCPICQQLMTRYTETNAFLTTTLYRSQCPTATELTDYCAPTSLKLLTCSQRVRIARHVEVCPLCCADLTNIYSSNVE